MKMRVISFQILPPAVHWGEAPLWPAWGISVSLRVGWIYRPVPVFWAYGIRQMLRGRWPNPWGHRPGDPYWFKIRIHSLAVLALAGICAVKAPVVGAVIFAAFGGPFVSCRFGRFKAYIGAKEMNFDQDYRAWLRPADIPNLEEIRLNLWHILIPSVRLSTRRDGS